MVQKSISKKKITSLLLVAQQWLQGGMGDTLAGMITSFVGQFDNYKDAVTSATYTHSYIGEKLSEKCTLYHLQL